MDDFMSPSSPSPPASGGKATKAKATKAKAPRATKAKATKPAAARVRKPAKAKAAPKRSAKIATPPDVSDTEVDSELSDKGSGSGSDNDLDFDGYDGSDSDTGTRKGKTAAVDDDSGSESDVGVGNDDDLSDNEDSDLPNRIIRSFQKKAEAYVTHIEGDGARELDYVQFGVASAEEILKLSVCEITNSKLGGPNSVYDERMGVIGTSDRKCLTCNLEYIACPGHYGHINLNYPIIHPMNVKYLLKFIKCFCSYCFNILIRREHLDIITKNMALATFLTLMHKQSICHYCERETLKYTYSISDSNIVATRGKKGTDTYSRLLLPVHVIENIVHNIHDGDMKYFGINSEYSHPRNLIFRVLPVTPSCSRPFALVDGVVSDDDLTLQYLEIVKSNEKILSDPENVDRHIRSLKFKIKTMFDNSAGKSRHCNNRPYKGIKSRICGKSGIIRQSMLGKRVNFSARTVLGPDTTLPVGFIAIPPEFADNLTTPEVVNNINFATMQRMVLAGEARFLVKTALKRRVNLDFAKIAMPLARQDVVSDPRGNIVVVQDPCAGQCACVYHTGDFPEPSNRVYRKGTEVDLNLGGIRLEVGDTVERKLRDGDYVLLNRQPTLHPGSLMSVRVLVKPGKTIRIPLPLTPSLAGDFDGDEANIFVPILPTARAEASTLMNVENIFLSSQNASTNIKLIQDSLIGMYKLTKNNPVLGRDFFFQLVQASRRDEGARFSYAKYENILVTIAHITKVQGGVFNYTGRELVSTLLPPDFHYSRAASDELDALAIVNGVLLEGTLSKNELKGGNTSVLYLLCKEYSVVKGMQFTNSVCWMADMYLMRVGFTVNMADCTIPATAVREIEATVYKGFVEASSVKGISEKVKEARVCAILDKTRDLGLNMAKGILERDEKNHFVEAVLSGGKGSLFNLTQIVALLGQQILGSGRIQPALSENKRVLIHYPFEPSMEDSFESRGFVRNSFGKGLNPKEFLLHTAATRETLVNTSMRTAHSGYLFRKTSKFMEDLAVKNDGTVRNIDNTIVSNSYGPYNLDGKYIVNKTFCDNGRVIERFTR